MTSRIPVHLTVDLSSRGSMMAFKNSWTFMPETSKERFRQTLRDTRARWEADRAAGRPWPRWRMS